MTEKAIMMRGAAKVREILVEEHLKMQRRAYLRARPYLVGALTRLRRAHPAFQTVVFDADKANFVLVFGDGTIHREAPKPFRGLREACEDLAHLSEIEWLTASDALWQVRQGTPQPKDVITQYHYVEKDGWTFWMRRSLRDARYYMRKDIYSRTFYGAQRAGFGKRIVAEDGAVVDEWVDPLDAMILRVLRAKGTPVSLDPLCKAMNEIAGWRDSFYFWDVFQACDKLVQKGTLRRVNPKSSEFDARFVLARTA